MRTAVNPQTNETVVLVDGAWVKADKIANNPQTNAKAYLINGKWLEDDGAYSGPTEKLLPDTRDANGLKHDQNAELAANLTDTSYIRNAPEGLLTVASGAPASVAGGLAGLAQSAKNLVSEGMPAGDRVRQVEEAFTYKPRTEGGRKFADTLAGPSNLYANAANRAGEFVSEKTGIPALGAGVNTAIQAVPLVLGEGVGRLKSSSIETGAVARAKDYATNRAGLNWDTVSPAIKDRLTKIADDPQGLEKLDPKAVARQSRLEALNLPATRGQITRDISQLTKEENLSKSETGKPIRDISAQQDERLHALLNELRGSTGAKVQTRQGVGESVQGALRSKLNLLKQEKNAKYDAAKKAGATQDPVDITPLNKWLENPTNRRNAPYLVKAIKDYEKNGKVSISDLEEIRKEANANSKTPGPGQHFAGEAKNVIDQILDNAGSNIYKEARASNRALKEEFARQDRIRKLVDEKGYTTDRAVALEDTFDHVIRGSTEDIEKIKESLLSGGSSETRTKGIQAWRDLQGATIDYLKEKASGKRAIVGENEQLQFNSSFREAFSELDKDGKIDAIFSPTQAKRLREIYQAVGDVRTKPSGRVSGSDTTPRLLSMLDSVSKLPFVGRFTAGTIQKVREIQKLGGQAKDVKEATTPLLESQLKESQGRTKRAHTLEELEALSPAAPLTLKNQNQ